MTKLQEAIAKSPLRRRLAAEFMLNENIPLNGFKQLVNGVFSEILLTMPDPDIKRLLYMILQCNDATPEERQEALTLLQQSDTALTAAQREALKHSLTESGRI